MAYSKPIVSNPLWYKDAIIYELHVRAFSDSNGDGIGDFAGLVQKLDYLQDLGATAIWLLPFYPSPLRDDGYDIADYAAINTAYGTMDEFQRFLHEAHARGLRVITELVINHTSDQHPWFLKARKSPPGSRWREFYVWSDSPKRYSEARIIFQDFEHSNWTWDHVAGAYYWHRFYSHQPDLNFENPEVQKEIFETVDFWMKMGVDGLRLDAVPYLYEREGTNCENLPETHEFLKSLRRYVDERYTDRMLLAEANQWPEDAATYFGEGDECHMNFHFPVMPRMFMSVQLENRFPLIDILDQTPEIPATCQWAVFLRNHDELTLEMVTDEDRDYMYRMYAADPKARINLGIRRRLAPLMKLRRKVELLNGLLFSLPGTPVLYYGDEIGMGDNIYLGDRDGVRTPMQWSPDRNAGFSRANPQKLYLPVIIDPEYHFQAVNVEAQQENPSSLLWWMKRLIAFRKQYQVFGRGTIEFLHPSNPKVLAFIREYEGERILAVFNLSRFAQYVELDLSRFEGVAPYEIWGATPFPSIGSLPYLLTLGPYDFYWFFLPGHAIGEPAHAPRPAAVAIESSVEELWTGTPKRGFSRALENYLQARRWFRSKSKTSSGVAVREALRAPFPGSYFLVLEAQYTDAENERYLLPVAFAQGARAEQICAEHPEIVIVDLLQSHADPEQHEDAVLYECMITGELTEPLLGGFFREPFPQQPDARLSWETAPSLLQSGPPPVDERRPRVLGVEQSNTSIMYGQHFMVKLFRRLEEGESLDLEIPRFLSEHTDFKNSPTVLGSLQYRESARSTSTVAMIQEYVPNEGDAWKLALDELSRYFERALTSRDAVTGFPAGPRSVFERSQRTVTQQVSDFIGPFMTLTHLLGRRTGELHVALASDNESPAFAPEPFSTLHQRSLYQSVRASLRQNFDTLRLSMSKLDSSHLPLAQRVLGYQDALDRSLRQLVGPKIDTARIRCHGDFHLGQVLYTGKDFYIIDFEGEPARSITQRRLKRSPLRDVAGMLRSFHYASTSALQNSGLRPEDAEVLRPWARLWVDWVCATYLRGWTDAVAPAGLLPAAPHVEILLNFYLVEKCIYELGYELDNRPDWAWIPLGGLEELAEAATAPGQANPTNAGDQGVP